MTLKEIAAQAGVSISTVSRIINSPSDSFARKEVRERVWAIVKATGYTPNENARELKRGKSAPASGKSTGSFACVLGRTKTLADNPFFSQLARVVEQKAMDSGYPIRLSYSIFDMKANAVPEKIASIKTDGAVILGQFDDTYLNLLEKLHRNIVYVGRNIVAAACDQVICDGYEATLIAMKYLVSQGHRRIAYLGETSHETRYRAYLDTLLDYGLGYSKDLVSECPQNGAGGYWGAERLLKMAHPLPTAVFCATDIAAIAALRRFTEAKIRIPDQLSLIGIDNIELSGYVTPMLTTVGMPINELGSAAVQVLISRIQNRHKLPVKVFLPNRLVIRESVACPNPGKQP